MVRSKHALIERRRYTRLPEPIEVTYITAAGVAHNIIAKNISADGMRFETKEKDMDESGVVELKLNIPATNPVHAKGKVIWKRKISLEDKAPFDTGMEFTDIEEDNKNTFLKFLCDLIYKLPKEPKDAK